MLKCVQLECVRAITLPDYKGQPVLRAEGAQS